MRAAPAAAAGVALMACTPAAPNDGAAPLSPVDGPRADDVPTDANEASLPLLAMMAAERPPLL